MIPWNGSVNYDVSKCIGCRYCMVACPFEIPAYAYHNPITPRVMKCTFCYERISKEGGLPGCASICPVEAITFGKRSTLLNVARERIKDNPAKYIDAIYGEKEVGGIGYVSNLSTARPWGLWIGVDVASGVALAAGGFTTAFLAHIAGRHYFQPVVRPALLTAMLGYTFVVLGLMVDIGRSWALWKPMFFWNPNSVLFEVAMCVAFYLNVLYIEFIPIVVEQFKGRGQKTQDPKR